MKIPETRLEHLENVRRDLYIRIGVDARDVAFDAHEYKISKRKNITMGKYEANRTYYDNRQISPFVQWHSSYLTGAKHTKALIKELFSIPFCKNKKLKAITHQLLNDDKWLKIADLYDSLQESTDAPEAHWQWRNAHKNPGKMAPEQERLMREDEKTGKLANQLGYQVKHFDENRHHCTELINKETHKGVQFNKLPGPLQKQVKINLALANYFAERK